MKLVKDENIENLEKTKVSDKEAEEAFIKITSPTNKVKKQQLFLKK